ncbi:MAG: adenylate/guanylate cyclase domain-containing protein [Bacteroidia bacterium]|nr:adenylate/guanylate cyclase domain-containing protein [Bacteroidia bacterium]
MNASKAIKLKKQLEKVFWITFSWVLISLWSFMNGYNTLKLLNCDLEGMDPSLYFSGSILTGVLAGVFGGTVMVFLWESWLRILTYGRSLFFIFLSFSLVYLMVSIPTNLYMATNLLDASLFSTEVWNWVLANHLKFESLENYLFWLLVVLVTLIVLQVNDKYGPGVFRDFILGKYFQPKREERIFMFLDLRSSTSIAEKLGEARYFNFINDVFKYATASILNTRGEIYQYVGDEIVISWKVENGISNANCLRCFFEVQEALQAKKNYFMQTYGQVPEFKAGLHYGHVMAGEIGLVKRDIAFSGDVLNTTARIQGKCNELGVNILLSKYLIDKLSSSIKAFSPQKIGDLLLKGKEEKMVLYTV